MERMKHLEKELKKSVGELIIDLQRNVRELKEENRKLREELSAYDREYFDEDKKAKNIFIDKTGKVVSGGEFRELC